MRMQYKAQSEVGPVDREGIKDILGRFPRQRTYLLPVLQAVQEEVRYLPNWAMEEVGAYLRVPKSEVHGVASSYPELRFDEPGKHVVRVCTGLQCHLNGASEVLEELTNNLKIQVGETTPDGQVTLEETPCVFDCALAPAIEWDGHVAGRMTPEAALSKLQTLAGRHR